MFLRGRALPQLKAEGPAPENAPRVSLQEEAKKAEAWASSSREAAGRTNNKLCVPV